MNLLKRLNYFACARREFLKSQIVFNVNIWNNSCNLQFNATGYESFNELLSPPLVNKNVAYLEESLYWLNFPWYYNSWTSELFLMNDEAHALLKLYDFENIQNWARNYII